MKKLTSISFKPFEIVMMYSKDKKKRGRIHEDWEQEVHKSKYTTSKIRYWVSLPKAKWLITFKKIKKNHIGECTIKNTIMLKNSRKTSILKPPLWADTDTNIETIRKCDVLFWCFMFLNQPRKLSVEIELAFELRGTEDDATRKKVSENNKIQLIQKYVLVLMWDLMGTLQLPQVLV